MEFVDLAGFAAAPELEAVVSEDVARRYRIVPLGYEHGRLKVAITDPNNFETLDALPHVIGPDIDIVCTTPGAIRTLQTAIYGNAGEMADTIIKGVEGASDGDAPIIRLVQNMLTEAFKIRAQRHSHRAAGEATCASATASTACCTRWSTTRRSCMSAIIARLKIMTGTMSIDEKRVPQDGRIQMKIGDKEIDLRVSHRADEPRRERRHAYSRQDAPAARPCRARLLHRRPGDLREAASRLPDGILLVTGPTGSGKTTTLYACLNVINKPGPQDHHGRGPGRIRACRASTRSWSRRTSA